MGQFQFKFPLLNKTLQTKLNLRINSKISEVSSSLVESAIISVLVNPVFFVFGYNPFIRSHFHTHNVNHIFQHTISLSSSNFNQLVSKFERRVCGRFVIILIYYFLPFFVRNKLQFYS